MRGVMIVGTASNVGKSIITTAICRIFVNEGYVVAPFKSQNMSHKIHFIKDDMKIALSQAIQAQAAKVEPTVWMNPIVLNAKSETTSEVILLGKTVEQMSGKKYRDVFYEKGLAAIKQSLEMLQNEFDVIVMEGAGSPVELNLKDRELVNMKIADLADVPVLLVADIDRGGVFASIIGTLELLTPLERERVQGIIINKFGGILPCFMMGFVGLKNIQIFPYLA
ncbi:cobyric acid synthase [Paracerasibacillus soli]|uniref:Cobyric acid synthase n=1 Tax=Paracerasibacillus soli TaxID=480284 RepID=A0ABU5CN72_9BACI|nr:cobyric acid synthase [Virgibacillus soli]MDY0407690.1 cobyric acid synthase [Virgibacillus soli]